MAGLLGTSWDDPRTMGLLGVAASLLQSSGSSPRPIGLGEALGRAMGVGLGTYSQSLDAQAQRAALQQTAKLREMQIKAAEQEAADTQLMRDTARQFYRSPTQQSLQAGGGPTNAAAAAMPNAQSGFDMHGFLEALSQRDPLLALKTRQSMQQAPIKLGEGDTLLDPTTYRPLAQGQPKQGSTPELTKLLEQREKLPEGHPFRAIYDAQIRKITTHAPAATQTVSNFVMPATPGQEAADKKFAGDFIDFVTGGYADVQKQLDQLREASAALGSGRAISGPIIGNVPDAVLAATNPQAVATKEAIQEVAQRNLRLILGAQFTEKEGERLIARVFNPRLSEAENKKRVDRLIRQIARAAQAKLDAAQYFQQHGSLTGWKGRLPRLSDFEPDFVKKDDEGDDPLGLRK